MQQKSPKSRLILLILFIIPIINPLSLYGFYAGRRFLDIIRILLFGLIIVLDTDNTVSAFAVLAWLVITILDFFLIIFGKFKDRNKLCISIILVNIINPTGRGIRRLPRIVTRIQMPDQPETIRTFDIGSFDESQDG